MKRKLIQIGNSTLLLSVPRDWVKANNLSKGDEVEIVAENEKLNVFCESRSKKERLTIDLHDYKGMMPRLLYATYKMGIDELDLRWQAPTMLEKIKSVIWKEASGFEIIDQSQNHCTIVNVSGKIDDFSNLIRRLFLVTLTMAEETIGAVQKKGSMKNILYLEQENNRLTTILTRAINKFGSYGYRKIGPLYYVVQELEKIGDQYKYLATSIESMEPSAKKEIIELLEQSSALLRRVYDLFYTFKGEEAEVIKDQRNELINKISKQFNNKLTPYETMLLSHSLSIITRAFDLTTSIIILKL